jgi:hypothetical protein
MNGPLKYVSPPTVSNFMLSDTFGRIIAGPIGSGKTTGAIMELLRRAYQQTPGSDGLCYTRFAICRQTLQQLKATVLKDCEQWFSGFGPDAVWRVSESTYKLNMDNMRSEWVFLPLEDAEDKARLLSMQLTGAFLSECIEMNLDIMGHVQGRIGRYPSAGRGTPTWHGIIADTNMPVEMSPWYEFFEKIKCGEVPNFQFFKQPGGLETPVFDKDGNQVSGAENLNYLLQTADTVTLPINNPIRLAQGRKYYENIVATYGPDHDYVNRYVNAEYGNDPSGAAVYKETFRSSFHVVDETLVIPGYPLLVAQDFGRNPWSLICQMDHMGRLLVHEEVAAENIGLEKHVAQNLRPRLFQEKFLGRKVAVVGDPAGMAKGSIGEESCFDALKRLGMPAFPAPTNDIDPRIRSVEALLSRQTNGGPTLLINRAGCPKLVRAMGGGYRYKRMKEGALRPKPNKDDAEGYSHVADCLQYAALIVHGGMMSHVVSYLFTPRRRHPGKRVSSAAWT